MNKHFQKHLGLVDQRYKMSVLFLAALLILVGLVAAFFPDQAIGGKALTFVFAGIGLIITAPLVHRVNALTIPGTGTVAFDKDNQEEKEEFAAELADSLAPHIQSIAEQGTRYINHEKAFTDVLDVLKKQILNAPSDRIELRLIAVAMCYSWNFVTGDLLALVRKHRNVMFDLRLALVKPDYLARFELDTRNFNWAAFSSDLPGVIKTLEKQAASDGLKNLSIETFYYEGIPNWHGILINKSFLFRGRTDWDWNTESRKPRLLVGSNPYGFYDSSTKAGKERIEQFRHWFTFYQRYFEAQKQDGRANG